MSALYHLLSPELVQWIVLGLGLLVLGLLELPR